MPILLNKKGAFQLYFVLFIVLFPLKKAKNHNNKKPVSEREKKKLVVNFFSPCGEPVKHKGAFVSSQVQLFEGIN